MMEEMDSIDAQELSADEIGEHLQYMLSKTEKNNSVTGKINNAEHGNVRIVMFVEDDVSKPYGAD